MKQLVFTLTLIFSLVFVFNNCEAKTGITPKEGITGKEEKVVTKLTKEVFLKKVWDYKNSPKEWKYKGKKPVIIDFYADWCGPCRTAAPILEEVAGEYKDKITVYKVDTQAERELASVFGVKGIPAFLYIPMAGKPTMTSGIGRSRESTKKMFVDNINKFLLKKN